MVALRAARSPPAVAHGERVGVIEGGKYSAVIFDVGGTLLNVVRDPRQLAVEAVAHLGALSAAHYADGIRQAVEEWRAAGGAPDVADLPQTWIAHNRRALEVANFEGDVETAARIIEDTFLSDGWELHADAVETLTRLRSDGWPLGVVSNWPPTLEATLHRAGIAEYFATIVGSGVAGYAKPHPQIFLIAAERLHVDPADALYIGDDIKLDVAGARDAEMDVLLLDRHDRYRSHVPRIRSLSEVPGRLTRIT